MSNARGRIPGYMQARGHQRSKAVISDREIRFKCFLQNTILDVLRSRPGWQEVQGDGEWDFFWCDREWVHTNYDTTFLQEHQKILHFRNHYELTRKNLMVKNLKRMRKLIEREQGKHEAQSLDFFPSTFELPSEYHIFVEEFKKNPGIIWIMKPAAKSQGRGIFLFRKLKDITDWKKGEYQPLQDPNAKDMPELYVVQRYIENPYLIGGRKFDIRVYVLVLSFNPLKVWVYRGGFARFSNTRFSLDSIEDNYVHLTNVAIQKTAPDFDPEKGCKWSTQQLRMYLSAKHGTDLDGLWQKAWLPHGLAGSIECTETELWHRGPITSSHPPVKKIFLEIDNIIIRSLQSVQKIIINDKHCFEMYGYDILLDDDLKPWLIEINASPSLTASGKEDYDLKEGLLHDVLNVLDLENRLHGREKRVGGWDLLWDDRIVLTEENTQETGVPTVSTPNTFLGCQNERRSQLRDMYAANAATKRPT